MKYLILLLGSSIIYKLFTNLYNLKRISFLHKQFLDFIGGQPNPIILESTTEVVDLFIKAKIKDRSLPFVEPLGLGFATERKLNFFENIYVLDMNISPTINQFFIEAKGYFKHQYKKALNPLYWTEVIIFLPQHFLTFIGIDKKIISSKIITVFYWIMTIILFIFEDEVRTILRSIFIQ